MPTDNPPDATTAPERDEGRSFQDSASDFTESAKRWAVVVVGLIVVGLIVAAVVPRWWSHFIGRMVDGSLTKGWAIGIIIGAACTLLPLFIAGMGVRARPKGKKMLWFIVPAVVTLFPNLFTLWIVVGGSSATHAGKRTFDVEAPGFRAASLIGVLLAVALFGFIQYLTIRSRHDRDKAKSKAIDDKAK